MDAILDLTSRAVSLVMLIQDSLLRLPAGGSQTDQLESNAIFHKFGKAKTNILQLDYFQENGAKISWVSVEPETSKEGSSRNCYDRCAALIEWMNSKQTHTIFENTFNQHNYFPAPEQWREAIRDALYANLSQRIVLADALQYLPIQVVLTAKNATKLDAKQQRLLQIWNITDPADLKNIISAPDEPVYDQLADIRAELRATANMFLTDEHLLIETLRQNDVPLSFLQIFHTELKEIESSRASRKMEIINCEDLCKSTREIDDQQYANFEQIFRKVLDPDAAIPQAPAAELLDLEYPISEPGDSKSPGAEKVNFIPDDGKRHTYANDVLKSSRQMELWALAFSGGGIRSASFNLGILQGLAKKGLIGKFDYLSTVSGGGYIGSWLVSWIARNRSVIQVSDLLDPKKSSDPLAEEVRPIRWLRMYSNYLTPTKGIMSADSWTSGMTLVRNMLVNQLVILSLFLTLIAFGRSVFMLWTTWAMQDAVEVALAYRELAFNVISAIFLLAGAALAGMGMQTYHHERFPSFTVSPGKKEKLPHWIIVVGSIAAVLFSAWMLRQANIHTLMPTLTDFGATYWFFRWIMAISFLSMVFIAILGRYDTCINPKVKSKTLELIYGIAFTLIAVLIGGALLAAVCKFGYYLACQVPGLKGVTHYPEKLCFIFLPPLVIEVLSITVILRMALLGASFPDERREWWGRIGGLIHRICLLWVVILALTMLGKSLIDELISQRYYIKEFFVAGWGATLLVGLQAAFGGTTSGESNADKSPSPVREALALLAPYLFVFAVMIFLPQLLDIIQEFVAARLPGSEHVELYSILLTLVALSILTWILSARIGVNQFSMHLFYRNRLIRAYLGATRIRLERARSANPFTGFDLNDDILVADLINSKEYFGPYPLINTTLSASSDSALDRQDRKAESFIFSPLYCGYDFSRTRASANALKKSYDFAYRPTGNYGYIKGPHIGTAMAISGAAANPNMGYHTSPATAFLLSVFNIRLGWWMGNPRMGKWNEADPDFGLSYLINDLAGSTDTTSDFVCLSDGGHFDNMGLYELIRRNCKYIILSDGEQDGALLCEGLANAIRRCRIDFGVEIAFGDIEAITFLNDKRFSRRNYAIGTINYPGNERLKGTLIYIKASMTENETVDLQEYAKKNKTFPHQSTADQFFNEEQFESYRKLGMNIVDKIID